MKFEKHLSEETKIKISETRKRLFREGKLIPPFLGKQHRKESKLKISLMKKGKHTSPGTEFKKGHVPWDKGKSRSEEVKSKVRAAHFNKHTSVSTEFKKGHTVPEKWKESYRKKLYERLKNDEYRIKLNKKRLTACGFKPNKKELFLESLIQSNFPNDWKYVGNGEVVLGAGCPDWINVNGQKKVILHHGIYWHLWRLQKLRSNPNLSKQDVEREDVENYKKYGFDSLIIWEDELNNPKQIVEKIHKFHSL